jgi:hypothetical protein
MPEGVRIMDMVIKRHFQQCFNYIVAVSFIGGENRSIRKTTDLPQVTDNLYQRDL